MKNYQSWGRYPKVNQKAELIRWRTDTLPGSHASLLPYGQGRSYGDCCLNQDGILLDTCSLNHFIHFDPDTGLLRCESGVTLDEILKLVVPHGWFLPVTPGTRFVTVGGAIANDVHGKNHHLEGTFGNHVRVFELLRSDGQRYICSADNNEEYFKATISGLGLTGLITWAEIQLKPINSSFITGESIRFENLEEFFSLSEASDDNWEYTVSWIDCQNSEGRGIFYRGNHEIDGDLDSGNLLKRQFNVGIDLPGSLLNKHSISIFNNTIYKKHRKKSIQFRKNLVPFFYPLDRVGNWNRLYGGNGFLQFQSVVPMESALEITSKMLKKISDSGMGSFLAVLKVFGDRLSPGMMSFPRKGVTLAMDFPFKGNKTLNLLQELDSMVADAGGAIYPAKDACMNAANFVQYYPAMNDFMAFIDPAFSSSFWQRVNGN